MTPFEPSSVPTAMARKIDMPLARFAIGEVVRHRMFDFRGVIFDVDPVFANSEEWYEAIPEALRPSKDQPFYHLLAENAEIDLRRLCQPAEPGRRRQRRAGRPSRDFGDVRGIEDGRYQLRREHRH